MDLLGDTPPGPVSLQKLSIEGIARQAGVSKMTIYRWWPNKAALVIDSFIENHIARTPLSKEGPAVDALRAHLVTLTQVYAGPEGRLVAQLLGECQFDPATLDAFKTNFWRGRQEAVNELIERGKADGEFREEIPTHTIADLLYAPIYFRLLLQTGELDVDTTLGHVDAVLRGVSRQPVRV